MVDRAVTKLYLHKRDLDAETCLERDVESVASVFELAPQTALLIDLLICIIMGLDEAQTEL
jgi:hypothetical protein